MIAPSDLSPAQLEHFINSGELDRTIVSSEKNLKEVSLQSTATIPSKAIILPSTTGKKTSTFKEHKKVDIKETTSSPIPCVPPLQEGESLNHKKSYAGDFTEPEEVPEGGYKTIAETLQTFNFPDPSFLVSFFNQDIADGRTTLHKWQVEISQDLAPSIIPTAQHPLKYCLVAANGSGKDAFIVAPFAIWFCLSKKRSRVIITSSSGTQLTAQTEAYIKDLAQRVNDFFGRAVFKIRQRYIRCIDSGSEIRMFATDEEGKAEGYHPIEPGAEMAIIVNEGKSVSEDIHKALRRCSGYNYWLEISSPGEPKGDLYKYFNSWPFSKRITSLDCPHISDEERKEDATLYGETSAYYRSKHLALFTTIGGQVIIPREIVDRLCAIPPSLIFTTSKWPKRVGIDLSAGGDELVISVTQANRLVEECVWCERDTTISADKIHSFLLKYKLPFDYDYIYADDGGVGHAIIDMLVRKGWCNIHRIHNQSPAFNRKHFGNRGAESYDRVKRLFEENIWNPIGMSELCKAQLTNRKVKDKLDGAKVFLQSKKEAKAHGFPSPDRADAFVLSLTGLTIEDFLEDMKSEEKATASKRQRFSTASMYEHYEDNVTFGNQDEKASRHVTEKKCFGSLSYILERDSEKEIEFSPYSSDNNN